MGILARFSNKKEDEKNFGSDASDSPDKGYLEEAEQLSLMVAEGVEHQDFAVISKQLTASSRDSKGRFVFRESGIVGRFSSLAFSAALVVVFAYCIFIGIATAVFSSVYLATGLSIAIAALLGLVVNIIVALRSIEAIRFKRHYRLYESCFDFKSVYFIEDIVEESGLPASIVVGDLRRAIEFKLIPQGHFTTDDIAFVVSDDVYEKYADSQAVFDRFLQKKLEEKRRIASREDNVNRILEDGENYIEKLGGYRELVKDKRIVKKIAEIEGVSEKIFREIDINPSQAQTLGVFLNYYLPTTDKLLDSYVEIVGKQSEGVSVSKSKKEIERALDSIIAAYEEILEQLYQEYEFDILSDIEAMELSMRQEGLLSASRQERD